MLGPSIYFIYIKTAMSGGTKPHQLAYYGEMHGKVKAARDLLEKAYPGKAEAIFAAASKEAYALITRASIVPKSRRRYISDLRREAWGALHELLTEVVEARDTTAADKAEAEARELGISDPDVIELIRTAADDLFDLMATMERDHYEGDGALGYSPCCSSEFTIGEKPVGDNECEFIELIEEQEPDFEAAIARILALRPDWTRRNADIPAVKILECDTIQALDEQARIGAIGPIGVAQLLSWLFRPMYAQDAMLRQRAIDSLGRYTVGFDLPDNFFDELLAEENPGMTTLGLKYRGVLPDSVARQLIQATRVFMFESVRNYLIS